jgi:hypothetical protein
VAGKARNASKKKTVTLKTIKEQLDWQDKKMTRSLWWSFAATVGVPVFLVGLVGFVGVKMASIPNIAVIYWLIVAFVGVATISTGVSMAVKASRRNSTIAKKDKKFEAQDEKIKKFPLLSLSFVGFSVFLAGWVGALEALMARNPNFVVSYLYVWFVVMFIGLAVMIAPLWIFKNRKN